MTSGPSLVWEEMERLGMVHGDVEERRAALTVGCPWCSAGVGFGCVTVFGEPLTQTHAHPSRLTLARETE